jgi:hypothetical protein
LWHLSFTDRGLAEYYDTRLKTENSG